MAQMNVPTVKGDEYEKKWKGKGRSGAGIWIVFPTKSWSNIAHAGMSF